MRTSPDRDLTKGERTFDESTIRGSETPRLFTKPLRRLTRKTSLGFEIIEWAERELNWKPLPWQRWLIIRAHELLRDGQLRFSKVLFLAARQNGKSTLVSILCLYWMTHGNPKVLYSSASLDTAKDQWETVSDYCEEHADLFGTPKLRKMNGHWSTELPKFKASYTVISANRRGGRGKFAVNRALVDELREHIDFDAMAAVESTMLTVPNSQLWMLSNAGDRRATVLNHYRNLGQTGDDPELGYFEWSAPEDAAIDDVQAWAQANPGLGHIITTRALRSLMSGPASVFKTENLCIGVASLNEAVSPDAWANCLYPGTLTEHRSRVVVALDVSGDLRHATVVAAATLPDGRVRVEVVAAYESTTEIRTELPDLLARIKPRHFVWLPAGPAGAISTDLKAIANARELTGADVNKACQGLAELVAASRIAHNGDELLSAHILQCRKVTVGDGWKFDRKDSWIDAAFACAAAVHIARTIPAPSRLKFITGR